MLLISESSNLFYEADEHVFQVHGGGAQYLLNNDRIDERVDNVFSQFTRLRLCSNVVEARVDWVPSASNSGSVGAENRAWKGLFTSDEGIWIGNKNISHSSGYKTVNFHANVSAGSNVLVSGNTLIPIGTTFPYAGITSPPSDYLFCDGTAYNRITYSALFSVIGTTYGTGNGSTTFNIPNITGRTVMGSGAGGRGGVSTRTLGATTGNNDVLLTNLNLPPHTHTITETANTIGLVRCTISGENKTYDNNLLSSLGQGTAPDVVATPVGFGGNTLTAGGNPSLANARVPLLHSYTRLTHIIKYR